MGEMITIPLDEYPFLKMAAQDLEDLCVFQRAMAAIESGEEELVPGDIVARMMNGERPLRVWREYRGMTQASLANASGVNARGMLEAFAVSVAKPSSRLHQRCLERAWP